MRKFEITYDGKPYIKAPRDKFDRQMRVTFTASACYSEHTALLDLAIYNVTGTPAFKHGAPIILSAGYTDEYSEIFSGTVTTVLKERNGADVITRLLCRAGPVRGEDRPKVAKSFGRNTQCADLINYLAGQWGKRVVWQTAQFSDAQPLIRGYVLNGDVCDMLDNLAQQFAFKWVADDDAVYIDRPDYKVEGTPREVSMLTGLIGLPEATADNTGVFADITMKLSPRIRLSSVIELKSQYASFNTGNMYFVEPQHKGNLNGRYKVVELRHEGDSWGDKWQTRIKGQNLEGLK